LAALFQGQATGSRFLLARASRGREVLAESLSDAGADVDQIVVYESSDVVEVDPEIAKAISDRQIDWVTVTSSAIARSLISLFGSTLHQVRLASISPITSATLREAGYEPDVEAASFTMEGMVTAIQKAVKKNAPLEE
jgi:uroporphyrinogen III methyltransferase/synthase